MTGNPIHRLLDDRGVPWRESMTSLASRYGRTPNRWSRTGDDVVLLDTQPPFLPGLLRPLTVDLCRDHDPAMPAVRMSAYAWTSRTVGWLRPCRARAALQMVHDSLAPALGPPQPKNNSNTYGWRWAFGLAAIDAICFPPRLQTFRGGNSVHDAEPRAATACYVGIETGYRPACSDEERRWIDDFVAAFRLDDRITAAAVTGRRAYQHLLEYVRAPYPGFERTLGRLGRSADGRALIFTTDQLYIVPTSHVDHVDVSRLEQGRGGPACGLARFALRGDFGGRALKQLQFADAPGADGISDQAARIADWLGVPCVLGDYDTYD